MSLCTQVTEVAYKLYQIFTTIKCIITINGKQWDSVVNNGTRPIVDHIRCPNVDHTAILCVFVDQV